MQQQLITQEAKPIKRFDYPIDFEWVWSNWQKQRPRAGADPKKRAFKAFSARQKEGHTAKEMIEGLCRYGRYCEQTGKFGTEYVMQLATFFGPDCHFENPWLPPKAQEAVRAMNQSTRDRSIEEDLTDISWADQQGVIE